jgi:hypothetical protein
MIGFDSCGADAAGCTRIGAVVVDKTGPFDDGNDASGNARYVRKADGASADFGVLFLQTTQ